jgi:hypothetical protein
VEKVFYLSLIAVFLQRESTAKRVRQTLSFRLNEKVISDTKINSSDNKGDDSILRTSPRSVFFLFEAPQLHIFMRRNFMIPPSLAKETEKMMRVELFSLITASEEEKLPFFVSLL